MGKNYKEEALKISLERNGYVISGLTKFVKGYYVEGLSVSENIEFDLFISDKDIEANENQSYLESFIKEIKKYEQQVLNEIENINKVKEADIPVNEEYYANLLTGIKNILKREYTRFIHNANSLGRKTGKTSTILQISRETGYPIVVRRGLEKRVFEKLSKDVEVYSLESDNIEELSFDIVLVDMLHYTDIRLLEDFGCKPVGFVKY